MMHMCLDIMKLLSCLLLLVMLKVDRIGGDCILSLKSDFGSPSPVYLLGGDYLTPNTASGAISVRRGALLTVACPQRTVTIAGQATRKEAVDAKCVSTSTFSVGRWTGELNQLNCSSAPVFTVKETSKACYRGGQPVKVGYTVRDKLYELYSACFDRGTLNTLFVKHELTPSSVNIQSGHNRPQFTGGDLFPSKVHIEKLYKTQYEKDRFNEILGPNMADKYFSKNQFLTRGHLAPRADFSLAALQRATFHFVNVAPQWMKGNRGDWGALEEALRRRVKTTNSSVTVYTGTHGVLALPGTQGEKELYLYSDENNNMAVPVPLYFYKLVHDPARRAATAFITINSSFFNASTENALTFCDDACASWLTWRDDATHSFCCSYDTFSRVIDHVPQLEVNELY
ncbi:uncharacterized protein LOC133531341 isoform X1 [Cydia pomonella]|uniref:uncharacterized protein LOC133531341 isoform X1 n=1 Tax=Cydia pomonella TaxID=82600 RepID=UPI002ADD643A|nr:uncharacterized protein LOC133531341 isoform X1 [Cydia pomonella]XP_061725480.1 uncharacterized protein LOC133531341 isoform X1 [Cydia pomonella]XP_061725481.1 uncharacterized protein LOC133531341 isoform X1 [Cydia pomonella]XP_061725483.1 uncharacterized protein LOC133531341 isoform X1 [Cydia pomonella]